MMPMVVTAAMVSLVTMAAGVRAARADSVFDVCKGESQPAVAGTGQLSIAVVYPDGPGGFPAVTTPAMRNAVAAQLARREKAIIVPAKDVEAARKLVASKQWVDKGDACELSPSLVAVLGQKHKNLSTATASVECDGASKCTLHLDLERHGRPTAERYVRYSAPLTGPKDKVKTIQAAGAKLVLVGETPNHPTEGLKVAALPTGKVTVRSDVDGALETDKRMESDQAFAACRPGTRKPADIRGYYADWMLSARGTTYQVTVKPFVGRDPADDTVGACLEKALEATKVGCPRDAKPVAVKTAICL